jgi:HupE / UreJ protein
MFGPDFNTWLQEGFRHIITPEALDHILFITALCLGFTVQEWKKLLLLVTAFTIGHSVTLLATAMGWLNMPVAWVEFAIPLTIAVTAGIHLFSGPQTRKTSMLYLLALLFGFIHGMAFGAIPLASLYSPREALPLILAFNLGVEAGQLLVVAAYMLLSFIFVTMLHTPKLAVKRIAAAGVMLYAIFLSVKNAPL